MLAANSPHKTQKYEHKNTSNIGFFLTLSFPSRVRMKYSFSFIFITLLAAFANVPTLAQSRVRDLELGTMHSPKSFGLTLEFLDDEYDSSDLFELLADMHGLWDGTRPVPGFKFTYLRNVCITDFVLDKTIQSSFYVGPGVSLGYIRDSNKPFGFMAGVSATMGVKMRFPSRIVICLEVGTDFGLFVSEHQRSSQLELTYYQSGLKNFYYPQLRIAYSLR